MLKSPRLLLSVLLLSLPGGNVRAQQPQETPHIGERARVVGEPRSEAEMAAWVAVAEAEDGKKRVRLARKFLADYSDSGLTVYAYRVLANEALEGNDIENFIMYAEKTLLELPDTPELLSPIANIYSERGEVVKATEYATRALTLLDELGEKPDAVSSIQWVTLRHGLRAAAHYALGRAHLEVWNKSSLKPSQELQQAVEHLNQALKLDPEHAYAAFRLGFAQSRSHEAEAALAAYSRASVIEGPAAGLGACLTNNS